MSGIKETYYVDTLTQEITTSYERALELYDEGHDVDVWSWSEALQEMVNRVSMVHV